MPTKSVNLVKISLEYSEIFGVRQKLIAMARPLRHHKVIYQFIKHFYTPINAEILVTIGPLNFEIQEIKVDH